MIYGGLGHAVTCKSMVFHSGYNRIGNNNFYYILVHSLLGYKKQNTRPQIRNCIYLKNHYIKVLEIIYLLNKNTRS